MTAPRTWITCLGNANDPQAWSAIPYHLLEEGRRQGIIDGGVPLRLEARWIRSSRRLWNLRHVLTGHRPGGFQYSKGFLERIWADGAADVRGCNLISTFQVLPQSILRDPSVRRWFYLDGTLTQLRDYYGQRLDRRYERDVLAREAEGYRGARGVFTMSRFAADSVVRDYGVDPARVHVVVPGANFTAELYDRFDTELQHIYADRLKSLEKGTRPLKLIFVGRDATRKGIDRLVRAMRIGRPRGLRMTLRIIGLTASDVGPELRGVDGVEWLGVISRRTDTETLLRSMAECDIGCLLSRAELAGISIRESLALGQPVIGPATGGSPDLMPQDICWGISADATDEMIADLLLRIERDPSELQRRTAACVAARRDALWCPAIAKIGQIMQAAR